MALQVRACLYASELDAIDMQAFKISSNLLVQYFGLSDENAIALDRLIKFWPKVWP